jgi:hypothetical protein
VIYTDASGEEGHFMLAFYYDINGKFTLFDSYGYSPAFFGLEAYIEKTSTKWDYQFFPILVAITVFILFY